MERDLKIAIVVGIVTTIVGTIVGKLWDPISPVFLNALFLENITINQSQAYLGIVLFAVVLALGIFLGRHILSSLKEKPIEVPPTGINYIQLACSRCNRPVFVYPPAEKYKEVVSSECEDKDGESDHNIKKDAKCRSCHKKFEYYWCTGHFASESVKKRTFNRRY